VEVLWIVLGVVALILIAGIVSYNRFVSQKNLIRDAWANIDTELRRRYDLIPNLVETVRGYAAHERETFERVTQARNAAVAATGSPAEQAAAEGPFVAALRQLFAVAEAYPQLRANENFLALQGELTNTEDRLQTARRFYNGNVRDYNRRVQAFPSNVMARMFKFTEEEFFEVEEALREAGPPRVDFGTRPGAGPAAPPPAAPPAAPTPGVPPAAPTPGAPPAAPTPTGQPTAPAPPTPPGTPPTTPSP
jgi:LemA protein